MLIQKGYKYRIYPNKEQRGKLARVFGCVRYVYNYFLTARTDAYAKDKTSLTYTKTSAMLTELKKDKDHLWLAEVDSMALQEGLRDLDRAYQNFFRKNAAFPKYHGKHDDQSYRTRNQGMGIRIEEGKLRLPTLGLLKIKLSRDPLANGGRILNATVSMTKTGKYFVSLCVEEELVPKPGRGGMIGIDLGLKEFYTDSNGKTVDNPKPLALYQKKLMREQRSLSRMIEANIKGYGPKREPIFIKPISDCSNIQKQLVKIAKLHEKIANIREDMQHKESLKLVNENQVIAVETLNIRGMLKNHKLAKAISDASWGSFVGMLEYKAFERGGQVIKVPAFFASSQTCSKCGFKNPKVKDLSVRRWICPCCGTSHERDENAAVNILRKALSCA